MYVFRSLIALFLFCNVLHAHQTGLSYVEITENDRSENIEMVYKKPLQDSRADNISIRFRAGCTKVSKRPMVIENGYLIQYASLLCDREGLMGSRIWVEGLVSSDKGVLIHYKKGNFEAKTLLRSTTPFMVLDHKSSTFKVFLNYLKFGIFHILIGADHLLFMLSLVLLVSHFKTLLGAITAFTLSHSLTLILSIFGMVRLPPPYVETMIALSVMFLAREVALPQKETLSKKQLGIVAFIFGLLHGLGFSSVLSEIGLPQDELPLALFAFNAGIETGQLIFILSIFLIYSVMQRLVAFPIEGLKKSLAYPIGGIATYWLIERLLLF